ncbi:MAG: hypothetical protein GF347_03705 [Candidatus Moranbacteria bacterium]|nr:hypothetical protein [Candidatus Moranbacteria bacterium]
MKKLFLFAGILFLSACSISQKSNTDNLSEPSSSKENLKKTEAKIENEENLENTEAKIENKLYEKTWIKELIEKEESKPVSDPPASLSKCSYKNQTVYYLPARCCDIASILYNENGDMICSPDGGYYNEGDGKCPDFFKEKKDCEYIWKDNRS